MFQTSLIKFSFSLVILIQSIDTNAEGAKIKRFARALQPGEIIRLTVESNKTLLSLEARAFGKSFAGYFDPSLEVWRVFLGVDLDVKPATHEVVLLGTWKEGGDFFKSYRLVIQEKVFPTRHLTVDPKYVNPPSETLERIRKESKITKKIFSMSSDRKLWTGPFVAPVPGQPNSSFGKRSILNGKPRSPHSGTDFSGSRGTSVKTPNTGKVVLVRDLYYSGNTIIVDHGLGLYSYFAHLSKTFVSEGQKLKRGEILGEIGATGRVTGPHLHWAVRLNQARVDPLSLIVVSESIDSSFSILSE